MIHENSSRTEPSLLFTEHLHSSVTETANTCNNHHFLVRLRPQPASDGSSGSFQRTSSIKKEPFLISLLLLLFFTFHYGTKSPRKRILNSASGSNQSGAASLGSLQSSGSENRFVRQRLITRTCRSGPSLARVT